MDFAGLSNFYDRTRNAKKIVVVDFGFLGDALHLLRLNEVALGPVLLGAFSCFAEECAEEGESVPDLIDVLCAACTPGYSFDVQPHRAAETVGRCNHQAHKS